MDNNTDQKVYGLIEWDGAHEPTLIVGGTVAAVKREALRTLTKAGVPATSNADLGFVLPVPADDAADDAVDEWLTEFRAAATAPWFSILEHGSIVFV